MALDPQSLASQGACYTCFGGSAEDAFELALLATIAVNGILSAPQNLDISNTSTIANVVVTWTNPSTPATANEVWKSTDGITYSLFATVAATATTANDATGMNIGDEFFYKVRRCNGTNCSAFTDPRSAGRLLGNPLAVSFSHPWLVLHFGALDFAGGPLNSISVPLLRRIVGDFNLSGTNIVGAVEFPSLRDIVGFFDFQNTTGTTSLTANALVSCADYLQFNGSLNLVSISFNSLVSLGNQLGGSTCANLTTASFPSLVQTIVGIFFIDDPLLTSLNLNSLQNPDAQFFIRNTKVSSINLPALTTTTGTVSFDANPSLVSISCPLWANSNGDFICANNGVLTTVSFPVLTFQSGFIFDFQNCIITAGVSASGTGINGILARGVASPGPIAGCTFDLNSPGNAAPTGQGLVDKATLTTNGNLVNTN